MVPRTALADDITRCVEAHERAQELRLAGKLRQAHKTYVGCSAQACPAVVREECTKLAAETESAIPTVAVVAYDERGRETTSVRIRFDGELVADKADGLPIQVDPGEHSFLFEFAKGPRITKRVVLREGEKSHEIEVGTKHKTWRSSPASYLLGTASFLALGSFAVFGLQGLDRQSSLDNCRPYCSKSQYGSMRNSYLVADVSLGVGVALIGTWLYLDHKHSSDERPSVPQASWVQVSPSRNGGVMEVGGRF